MHCFSSPDSLNLDDQVELLEELSEAVIRCDPALGISSHAVRRALLDWLIKPSSSMGLLHRSGI